MANLFEMRIVCKGEECNRYILLMEECLGIHKKIFHGDQQFKDEHRPIEHCCSKGNEGIKCNALIHAGKTQIQRQKGQRIHRHRKFLK